jgi:hypothetical protein
MNTKTNLCRLTSDRRFMRGDWDRLSIIELRAGMAVPPSACRGQVTHGTGQELVRPQAR